MKVTHLKWAGERLIINYGYADPEAKGVRAVLPAARFPSVLIKVSKTAGFAAASRLVIMRNFKTLVEVDHPISALVTYAYPYPAPYSFAGNPFPGTAFQPYPAPGLVTATPHPVTPLPTRIPTITPAPRTSPECPGSGNLITNLAQTTG